MRIIIIKKNLIRSKDFPLPKSQYQYLILGMSLQELIDYYDSYLKHQKEIRANVWDWWQMGIDELIDKLGEVS